MKNLVNRVLSTLVLIPALGITALGEWADRLARDMKPERKAELMDILKEINAAGHRLNNVSFMEGVAMGDPDTNQEVVDSKADKTDRAVRDFELAVIKLEDALK